MKIIHVMSIIVIVSSLGKADVNSAESPLLRNIQQITTPAMGFEKAGESYFSPDGTHLIFQAVPHGQKEYQIYTIGLNEGVPCMVSPGTHACTCGFFRPDGKKIIFASSHSAPENSHVQPATYQRDSKSYTWELTPYMNIYQANPDGSELEALTTGSAYSAECAYSADGRKIVFASNRSGSMNLYTMNADGSNVQQLTHDQGVYNGGPFLSPDGNSVIYRADHTKKNYLQIYLFDLRTQQITQLTDNGAVNWAPFWHPNGKVIAFTTSLHGHHQYELYLLDVQTKKVQRLTYNTTFDGLPTFNKDGTKITWTSKRGPDKTSQVFVADFVLPDYL